MALVGLLEGLSNGGVGVRGWKGVFVMMFFARSRADRLFTSLWLRLIQ